MSWHLSDKKQPTVIKVLGRIFQAEDRLQRPRDQSELGVVNPLRNPEWPEYGLQTQDTQWSEKRTPKRRDPV